MSPIERQAVPHQETVVETRMTPTEGQESITDAARRDRNIAINAFAGTGRTTILSRIAQALPAPPADVNISFFVFRPVE